MDLAIIWILSVAHIVLNKSRLTFLHKVKIRVCAKNDMVHDFDV
jgi:hypothetical protein